MPGILITDNQVECKSPPSESLTVPVSVKPDVPGETFADSLVSVVCVRSQEISLFTRSKQCSRFF